MNIAMSYLVLFGGRPSGALCPSGDPGATTAGLQLFQCATTMPRLPVREVSHSHLQARIADLLHDGQGPDVVPSEGSGLVFPEVHMCWVSSGGGPVGRNLTMMTHLARFPGGIHLQLLV